MMVTFVTLLVPKLPFGNESVLTKVTIVTIQLTQSLA